MNAARAVGASIAFLLALGLYGAGVEPSAPMRQLEIRITDHKPGIADFEELKVGLGGISIHAKGQARSKGWIEVLGPVPAVDIVPLKDGRIEHVGTGLVPAGQYDAVRITFSEPVGKLHSGKNVPVVARDTFVAVAIDLQRPGTASILVDLFAENQTDHKPQRYVVKVKDVLVGG